MKIRFALALSSCLIALSSHPLWAEPNDQDTSALRLSLDKVSLYAETGKMDQAFALLDKLKAQYPNNPLVLQEEADLNLRQGNRGAGFAALNQALTLDPGNEDIIDRQRSAMLEQGSFAAAGYLFRQSKQANEQLTDLAGQAALSPSITAELKVDDDHLHTRLPFTAVNGTAENFSSDRQRATATIGKIYTSGDESSASLYAGNDSVGGGASYRLWDHYGATLLQANVNRPDWDYVETVVENGTKDNIRIERKQIFSSNWQATLGGGYNHYNLQHDWNVASAAAWDLNVGYNTPYAFSSDNKITLGLDYDVSAEYFTHMDRRFANGIDYKPLDANSYEIHSLNATAHKDFSSQWYAEAFGGYSIDRLGGNGPSFGGVLEYMPLTHLGAELRASREIMGARNGGEVSQVGLNLKWRW